MRRNPRFPRVVLFLLLAACTGIALGQVVVVGVLSGQVKDETGAALPGATVTIVSVERGVSATRTTDSTGRWRLSEVQPGRYNVTVSLSGFTTITSTNNVVENQKTTDVDFTLKLTGASATGLP